MNIFDVYIDIYENWRIDQSLIYLLLQLQGIVMQLYILQVVSLKMGKHTPSRKSPLPFFDSTIQMNTFSYNLSPPSDSGLLAPLVWYCSCLTLDSCKIPIVLQQLITISTKRFVILMCPAELNTIFLATSVTNKLVTLIIFFLKCRYK